MLKQMKRAMPALAVVFSFALLPQFADAQERAEEETAQECSVEVAPGQVQAGQSAVSVTVRLSEDIGKISGVEAEGGAIALASPEDVGQAEMARTEEGEEPQPVKMARTGNQATVWLNTEDAEGGTHGFVLQGENGQCSGQIEVAGDEQQPPEEGIR